MKDREPIRMTDREVEFESPIVKTEGEQARFVTSAMLTVAEGPARYSVSPTPTSIIEIGDARDNEAIAKALAQVSLDDPNLGRVNLASEEGIAQATILALAKAKALEKEVKDPKVKTRLEKFSGGLSESVGSVLVKVGGRKAVTGAAALSLVAAACSNAVGAQGPEVSIPTPEAPATQIAPSLTQETDEVAVSQRYLTEEELMAMVELSDDPKTTVNEAEINRQGVESAFSNYQVVLAGEFPGATFAKWGIESAMLAGGPIISPFFETVSPDGKSLDIAILISSSEGNFEYIRLVPIETEVNGKTYLTLSQTVSAETGNEMPPEPFFWLPYSREEWESLTPEEQNQATPFFNGLGGIVLEAQNISGAKTVALRELISPAPETPEQVFVPEGFVIAAGGLLRNPETGRNALAMNPEADWGRLRDEIIGGLWQANMDWYRFTGETSDALIYSREEFIQAAKEGRTFRIGIPVRDNLSREEVVFGKSSMPIGVRLKTVDVRLDSIQIQLLDPNATREHTGERGWLADDQEAFVLRFEDAGSGNGALLFGVDEQGQLTITAGSYYFGETVAAGRQFEIGRFGNGLDEKYPAYFREDGLGVNADRALSLYFASMVDWLNFFPDGESYTTDKQGRHKSVRVISMLKTADAAGVLDPNGGPCVDCWYLNPPVVVFVE